MMRSLIFCLLPCFVADFASAGVSRQTDGPVVHYDLTVENRPMNLSGHKTVSFALTVNGGIPAPTLEFTEGDTAEITVHNRIPGEEVSLHWHGLLLPPEQDGVAYVNTPPILSGRSHTFRFKVRQHGTFWYHSHTSVQEQMGVYGAFVIHPKTKTHRYERDVTVVLSDWSDEDARHIISNLRKDGDYYLFKKNSVRSYWGSLQSERPGGFATMLANEWARMGGMDLSDVGYDAFLTNGKPVAELTGLSDITKGHPGETIRLRIINAAASTYFNVALGAGPMTVISADGSDIVPIQANEILMGMAETYDVLFTVPDQRRYELRATAQDGTGYTSGWIGSDAAGDAVRVYAPDKEKPDPYAPMDHSSAHDAPHDAQEASASHSAHHSSHHSAYQSAVPATIIQTLTVDKIEALEPIAASEKSSAANPAYDVRLVLGGDMSRYVWHINGKAIHQDRTLTINEGDIIRFTFENETMMHHPMHLHGHFFRVLTAKGNRSPLKHTVDVPPHASRTIEFRANEPGQWMLHCHNLYHMKTGMARVVRYSSYSPSAEMLQYEKNDPHQHDHLYSSGSFELATNHAQARLRVFNTWDSVEGKAEIRNSSEPDHIEGELIYRRFSGQFLSFFSGVSHFKGYRHPHDGIASRGLVGVGYILPFLVSSQISLDHVGTWRIDFERRFQWTGSLHTDVDVAIRQEAETEFEATLMYARTWEWSVGLMFTESKAGFGARYRF